MRRLIAIVVAAAVVAAAGIGIGLSSFTKPPSQPANIPAEPNAETPSETSAPETLSESDNDINSLDNIPGYMGLLSLGYNDQAARYLSSVKLEMISSNNTYYHYVQTTPNGTRSESILSFTPNEQFNTTDSDKITVAPGFDIFAKHVQVDELDEGYHLSLAYFIPEESMPTDLEERLSSIQPVQGELPFGIKYASAQNTLIYGTGVALDRTVTSPPRIAATPPDDIAGTISRNQINDNVREVQQMIYDRETAEIAAREASDRIAQSDAQYIAEEVARAERQAAAQQNGMLQTIRDRANRDAAAEALSRTSGRIVTGLGTAWTIVNIYDDHTRFSDRLSSSRDCWKNPTNRLAQEAQRNDPFYERLGENLDTARTGLIFNTSVRVVNQGVDAMAGASTGFAGGMALGGLAQAGDAMLWNAQIDEISDAITGITPCTPCPEEPQDPDRESPPEPAGDHTPGPDEPGFYYTPGPRESYEPPERQVCRPPEPNQLTVVIHEVVTEEQGTPREVTFQATANVTNLIPIPGAPGSFYQQDDFYVGNATGFYHEIITYPDATLPAPSTCRMEFKGDATMEVTIKRHMSGAINERGEYELSEVNISITGDLPISQSPAGCFYDSSGPSSTADIPEALYGCNFFDVNESGGTYNNGTGPDNDRSGASPWFYDDCELTMGPLIPELMGPG